MNQVIEINCVGNPVIKTHPGELRGPRIGSTGKLLQLGTKQLAIPPFSPDSLVHVCIQ